jgi:single-stranded DNA-specific DHH superfamily exonuclease
MLISKQVNFLKDQLAAAKNPLFLFDDDPDGLCSFLLLYRINREGHGIVVKSIPKITTFFLRKVEEYLPDKIFILDMPIVDQEFIDAAKRPIFWIDHHQPLERQNIQYFNPLIAQPDIYLPTTRMAYQISQNPKDLWLAMVGCIADYHMPDFQKEFVKKYPDLMEKTSDIEKAIYRDPIGRLARVFSFLLKGKTSEVNRCIKILTRIKSPYEILKQQTSQGKFIYKRFEKIDQKYLPLLQEAKKEAGKVKGSLLVFTYTEQTWSFTAELAGELLHLYPDKIILVARKKSGEMKCSLRSRKIPISSILEKALIGIEGYGGGHEFACGSSIKELDWRQFLINLKRELK